MQYSSNGRLSLIDWNFRVIIFLFWVITLLAVWRLRDALMLVFLAVIVSIVLQMPVSRLERMGLSRGLSILLTMAGLFVLLFLLGTMIASVFLVQINDLVNNLPDAVDRAREEYDNQADHHNWLPDVNWDEFAENDASNFVVEQAGNLSRNIFPFLTGLGGVIANILITLIIALFFVTDPTNYLEGLLTMVPHSYRPRALSIMWELGDTLRRWFVGQLISMVTLGALITLVMGTIMGLPNPVALGVIAGVMEFVPNFGSVLSVIPAVLVALTKDPELVPLVIIAYLVTQQLQSNLLMPRIMSRQISMPSAMILIAQIIGAALFGFLGLVLALPLAIVVSALLREIYMYDVLNTRPARIETRVRSDGTLFAAVTTETYRPEELSPGQAAALKAQGWDPFEYENGQIIEVVTPPSPALEQAARSQQAVWAAILTLAVAQGLALARSLLTNRD